MRPDRPQDTFGPRIRVLHVVRPAAGGMKEQVLALATGCVRYGVDAEVACPPGSEVEADARARGLIVHPVAIGAAVHPIADLRAARRVASLVRRGDYDVVHAHGFKAGAVGRVGAVLGGCGRRVVTVHNFAVDYSMSRMRRALYLAIERALTPLASVVVTVSDALRREMTVTFGVPASKVVTVRNGIDVGRFARPCDRAEVRRRLGIDADVPLVGTVSRFAPQKGLRYLVEAMPLIRRRVPGATLLLGGDGPLRDELESLAEELGMRDAVVFPGYVDDVPGLLGALDVFACPSLSEGLSIGTMEAMAAGVPVVASDTGGIPELLAFAEVGALVPPSDPVALAEAVTGLMIDDDRRARFARAAAEVAREHFGADVMISSTVDVYRRLMGEA